VGLGEDFSIALGLTLPTDDIGRLSNSKGVLRQKIMKSSSIESKKKRTSSCDQKLKS